MIGIGGCLGLRIGSNGVGGRIRPWPRCEYRSSGPNSTGGRGSKVSGGRGLNVVGERGSNVLGGGIVSRLRGG
jgi:hypothetical protein